MEDNQTYEPKTLYFICLEFLAKKFISQSIYLHEEVNRDLKAVYSLWIDIIRGDMIDRYDKQTNSGEDIHLIVGLNMDILNVEIKLSVQRWRDITQTKLTRKKRKHKLIENDQVQGFTSYYEWSYTNDIFFIIDENNCPEPFHYDMFNGHWIDPYPVDYD
jgi:hypothetical protein